MKIKRRTNILVQTERQFLVYSPPANEEIRCAECAELMLTARDAAVFHGIRTRHVYRMIEEEKIHYIETAADEMYVCPVSVKRAL